MEAKPTPQAEGVVTGLTVVIAGSRTYVGIVDDRGHSTSLKDTPREWIDLRGAIELMTIPERTAGGGVQMRVMPLMITPADDPILEFRVKPTAHFDRSGDQDLIRIYKSMTGKSPILVPGRVRVPS